MGNDFTLTISSLNYEKFINILNIDSKTWGKLCVINKILFRYWKEMESRMKEKYKIRICESISDKRYIYHVLPSGIKYGLYSIETPNKNKYTIFNYDHDKINGLKLTYIDGYFIKSEQYKNDLKDGPTIEWHKNGKKYKEMNYKNGVLHGLATYWYKNGIKSMIIQYENGYKEGLSIQWNEQGTDPEHVIYSDDIIIHKISSR